MKIGEQPLPQQTLSSCTNMAFVAFARPGSSHWARSWEQSTRRSPICLYLQWDFQY